MQILLNVIAFLAYTVLAGAVALHAPGLELPGLEALGRFEAHGLGLGIFLLGALGHECLARGAEARRLRERALDLTHELGIQREDIDWQRRELAALREALEAAGDSGGLRAGGRTIEEVMAEVKVLKSLMARLSSAAEAPGAPNPAKAPVGTPGGTPGGTRFGRDLPAAVLVHDAGAAPPGALPAVADGLNDEQILETVRAALRNDLIDLVLQPIVSLPQRKRRFYECFSRLRTTDGAMIVPEQYIAIAERAGLITAIDNMLLFRCVQLIRKIHRKNQDVDFFCNISPHTLGDTDFFADFLDFLDKNNELAGHLVFEFAQGDFTRWSEAGAGLLERLSQLGCRISLDQVRDVDLDPEALAARRVSFVKVEANLLLETLGRRGDLMRSLRRREIDLIVEKVEDESRLLDLLDYEVDFGQGYLFGEPRLARPAA